MGKLQNIRAWPFSLLLPILRPRACVGLRSAASEPVGFLSLGAFANFLLCLNAAHSKKKQVRYFYWPSFDV